MRPLLVALALAGCAPGLSDATFPTGSSSLAVSSDGARVYALDADGGAVVTVAPGQGARDALPVGADPVRIARAGDLVFVALRGEGAIVVLGESGDGLSEVARLPVGPEPYGLVASEDGRTVYAAVSMGGEVVEIDVATLAITRRFEIGGQPRWVALHPSGRSLYVGSAMGGMWSHVDLDDGRVASYTQPLRTRVHVETGAEHRLQARITGDLAVSPRGGQLAIPVLYVDTSLPPDDGSGEVPDDGYGNAGEDPIGRTTPTLVLVELGRDGSPRAADPLLVPVVSFDPENFGEMPPDVEPDDEDMTFRLDSRRSYLSSVTFAPDSLVVLATMESSQAVLAVPAIVDPPTPGSRRDGDVAMPMMGRAGSFFAEGFTLRPVETIRTAPGPRGVVFLDRDRPLVDAWLARSTQGFDYVAARDGIRQTLDDMGFQDFGFTPMVPWRDAEAAAVFAAATLDPEVEDGRMLFFTAVDERMSAHGSGTACATCHFDGRNDGLTWALPNGELQTPSLAGKVSLTEPVTWLSAVPSVADEAMLTSEGRMGGLGLDPRDAERIAAFVDSTPYPTPAPGDAAAIARGKAVFEGAAQCATCHVGEVLTDNATHDMFGLVGVRTPTLRGIAATAPYLHDGRARTLEELVAITEAGGMGATSHLSDADKADLVAYLKSL